MLAQNLLMKFFVHDIEGVLPQIVDLKQPIHIVGMGVDTDMKRIYSDVPSLGKQFRKYWEGIS